MINLDNNVYVVLNDVCPTYMGYVREWQELPCISYLCTDNSTARKLDGAEYFTHFTYKVDLFCEHTDNYQDFCQRVDDAMSGLGFTREQLIYLQEENVHIVFYYSMYVDKNGYTFDNIY